jgi:hypothetical protein
MKKIWIILILLCCIVGCGKDEKKIFEVNDTVCLKSDNTIQGPIIRITRSEETINTYCVYHVKVYYKNKKGYIVFRRKKDELIQFLLDPR